MTNYCLQAELSKGNNLPRPLLVKERRGKEAWKGEEIGSGLGKKR
jgi:hypothetical protein